MIEPTGALMSCVMVSISFSRATNKSSAFCYNLFPTKIFKEDREEYISALRQSQEEETNLPFLGFMAVQLKKSLSLEIERFKTSQKKIFSFMF
jgi:mannose/fructose/N-acetylgalactosamine-specific phosphotransferase system component IID